MNSELITAIDRLVEEKTFNLDALEAIKDLRDKASRLEETVKLLEAQGKKHKENTDKLIKENNDLMDSWNKQNAKVAELEARDKQAWEAIYRAEKHAAVAEAYKDALNTVFRPHAVRERVTQNIPVAMQNGSNGYVNTTVSNYPQSTDITKEDV